jgi:hypothetical protein
MKKISRPSMQSKEQRFPQIEECGEITEFLGYDRDGCYMTTETHEQEV